jgi:uncharacterized protein (DUF983 family)
MPSEMLERTISQERNVSQASLRGLMCKCPNCGEGKLFARYLKITPKCTACGEELHHHQADDLPPYLTIMLVGHIIVPLILYFERHAEWSMTTHMLLWPAASTLLSLALLPLLKGAVVGLQWAMRMHGFGTTFHQTS